MKVLTLTCCLSLLAVCSIAQLSFVDFQRSYPRVASAIKAKEDTLRAQFALAGLQWPAKQIYIRSFKWDSQLEVWVRSGNKEAFKLFKTYKVCAMAGSLGPKRLEGDYQVPEGFYYINEFNPNSAYHLSLGLNYPNSSDKILSDYDRPGSNIYIHGNCVSTGCIPISDIPIEELFIIASNVKQQGQEFIPVHVFPVRYNVKKSMEYLENIIKENESLSAFNKNIRAAYDYFEAKKQLPIIMVNQRGEYVFN